MSENVMLAKLDGGGRAFVNPLKPGLEMNCQGD